MDVNIFLKYEFIRRSGRFNMITEANKVMDLIECSPEDYKFILNNYGRLLEESEYYLEQNDGVISRISIELIDRQEELLEAQAKYFKEVLDGAQEG